jgi:ketosteroid isomerase-like protein
MLIAGMYRVIAAAALVVTTGAASSAAAHAQAARQSRVTTERTLLALENEWTKAVVARDVAAFERLLAPGFVYTENNVVMSRSEVISSMTSGPDRVQWAGNEGMRVHDFGNTAVVTGVLVLRGSSRGATFNRRYRYTDTWMLRNGKWQAIAAQDYLIPH